MWRWSVMVKSNVVDVQISNPEKVCWIWRASFQCLEAQKEVQDLLAHCRALLGADQSGLASGNLHGKLEHNV